MRWIKSSAKAACSINGHVTTPWMRFVLGIHGGEAWAWLALAGAALLLTLVGLPKYSVGLVVGAALWRMMWVIVVPAVIARFTNRLTRPMDETAQRLFRVHELERVAWIAAGAASLILVLAHHVELAASVLVAAALCQVLASTAMTAAGRAGHSSGDSRDHPE